MKKLIYFVLAAVIFTVMYFLYQNQLGAVSFFGLSIFFFVMAIKEFFGERRKKRRFKDKKT